MSPPTIHVRRANRIDPTRTLSLRRRFERDLGRRFNRLISEITDAVVRQDALVLAHEERPSVESPQVHVTNVDVPIFDFPRSDQKARGFMQWLNRRVRLGVLEAAVNEGVLEPLRSEPWTNIYIRSAYQKGIERARIEAKRAGRTTFEPQRLGTGQAAVEAAFSQPFHVDRVALLYTRSFEELHGVTDAMAQQMRRVLAEGLAEGINPREMARRLNDRVRKVGRTRARTIARTETIRAHHVATIREYEAAGIAEVEVRAEWLTAGDDRVCEQCQDMEGRTYTLEEIEPLIPAHPNCRCVALPVTQDTSERE